ncbi:MULTISPECIES: ABC transporter permease [Candidatus Microthrix]|jgi:putative ABC transport system permease protein|uniref:Putative ABC-type antimicrobial peptide transport system n=1 Tax=Candidatus Neomicrothrix parvicella RN1 TaxID=1229780 RepID=R4Z6T5_9ACTN|nr:MULTISPECIES: ABC transporter permease [Microthrix]NLH66824.1 ABC transporter permease [Candidatus Microthrix parvicella]MBK7018102.1 ABC transporter permease [Candidatus Microthrix sp.]MBL0204811.1 ABC transporter permease [Candidatus Microthrix sp.]MBP6134103.1 ABC transporter permease [Candidatus Microthrix sp.]MBP6150315.1 ABC transporter permease [Candidatus Microthrix sp.]
MFLALRDLRFARGRFALVGLVIGLVALMATLLSGLANGLVDDGISGLRNLPLTNLAFQPGADGTFSRSTLTDANLQAFEGLDGVQASPIGVSFFNAKKADGSTIDMALFGISENSFLAPAGEAKRSLAGPPGIILSHEFEAEGLSVGDELTIVGVDERLPVLGFTYSGSYGHVPIAFTSLSTWQSLLYGNNAKGRFSAIALKAPDGMSFTSAEKASDTEVISKVAAYAGSPGYTGETSTMSLIQNFLVVISALIVGAFFTVWTVQRTGQIGLLKALGASNGYVLRDALGQMAIVLVGTVATGSLVAVGLGQFVGGEAPFRLAAGPILTSMGLLIVFGLVGCLIAVRRITSVDPIVALRSQP